MLTISLEQLQFHSFIGLYPEEKVLGSDFLLDIHVRINENDQPIDTLSETVDYAKVYELIKEEMSKSYQLLETVAQKCLLSVKETWPQIAEAEIILRKMNPPLPGEVGCSKITLSKKF